MNPYSPHRTYTPPDASIDELLALQKRLGVRRMILSVPGAVLRLLIRHAVCSTVPA